MLMINLKEDGIKCHPPISFYFMLNKLNVLHTLQSHNSPLMKERGQYKYYYEKSNNKQYFINKIKPES